MKISDLTKEFEGLRLKPYQCPAGKLTIGFGRNIEDNGITEEEASFMLDSDIARARDCLHNNLPFFAGLGEVRQGVMVDMCFNMGWPRFSQFKKMLAAVEARDWVRANAEMQDSRWARQVGRRARILGNMMLTGRWPS